MNVYCRCTEILVSQRGGLWHKAEALVAFVLVLFMKSLLYQIFQVPTLSILILLILFMCENYEGSTCQLRPAPQDL